MFYSVTDFVIRNTMKKRLRIILYLLIEKKYFGT
jgi:hypothetical protein